MSSDKTDACKATPSIPPSPRKGQDENPCPMTVEGIALIKDALIQARGALRLDAMTDEAGKPFGTTTVAQEAIGLALSTIRASEEDR